MNDRSSADTARLALLALAGTLAIQVYTALAAAATAVLAPVLAEDLGVSPNWVGAFVGLTYVGAMGASLVAGGFIARFGPIRVSQACVIVCALGVAAIGALHAGAWFALIVAALAIGFGYGQITPASSQVLARTASPRRMALTFSIKQTGVPAGAALAGAILPALALWLGWRAAFAAVAILGVAIAVGAQPIRDALDAERRPRWPLTLASVLEPLAKVLRNARLRELALVGLAYSATQTCILSFLVLHLTATLGWPLIGAGLGLSAATIGGVVGRIGWGAVADRTGEPYAVLSLVGFIAGGCSLAIALAQPGWPVSVVVALAALFGCTAIGWNGVQLAEVARRAPHGEAGAITGGAGFVTFAGVVAGPPSFAALAALTSSYRSGFLMTALLSAGCAALLRASALRRAGAREVR